MYLSFSGHMSGHVPTNTLERWRSVRFGRPVKTSALNVSHLFILFFVALLIMADVRGGFALTQNLVSLLEEAVFVLCGLSHLPDEGEERGWDRALGALALAGAALFLRFSVKLQSLYGGRFLHWGADTCERAMMLWKLFILHDSFIGEVKIRCCVTCG